MSPLLLACYGANLVQRQLSVHSRRSIQNRKRYVAYSGDFNHWQHARHRKGPAGMRLGDNQIRRSISEVLPTLHAIASGGIKFETLLIIVLLLAATLVGPSSAQAAPTVPVGFVDELVASVGSPTDIAFTPGGRLVVSTQGGVLYVKSGNSLVTALDLSGSICSDFERGMLGVTFDPDFNSNSYIYIFYTYNKANSCADNVSTSPVNRVSRFTMSGNTVSKASEVVLVDNMPSPNGNHNAGDLLFGKDGFLYISIGDGGCELNAASFCGGQNKNALKQNVLTGKVLRLTRDGAIPNGNPFIGSDSGRCNVTGSTSKTHCQETYLQGLRNPFRIAADPNAGGTKIYVNDVGQNVWEEIDEAVSGANYGWNSREGFCANGSTSNCGSVSGLRNPVFAYQHGSCNSITGGAFVPNGIWPSDYTGSYLYADYVCGKIFKLKNGTSTLFAENLGPVTTLQFGPYGSDQALYYSSYNGQVRRIRSTTNQNPIAVATADPVYGLAPLQVDFDGGGSSDPDNNALTFDWDFKDNTQHGTGSTVSHTFTANGVYQVVLKVTDSGGATSTDTIKIDVGNTPPVPIIESPLTSERFTVGETITLDGSAIDPQQGALPDSALKWQVNLHHDAHDHPWFSGTGNNLEFDAPAPEDLLAAGNSYLIVELTATDSTGLSTTITQNLLPKKVDLTIESEPSGLKVQIEGTSYTTPAQIETWAGNTIDLSAPDQLIASGEPVAWDSWSVQGGQDFQFEMPGTDTTVTANYDLITAPSFPASADARVREGSPNTNEGSVSGLTVKGGTTTDLESVLRFDVFGISGSVTSATLYLYAYEGTSDGPYVYKATGSWTESGVTWANRPRSSGGRMDDAGIVPEGTWFALDVTKAISGNGTFNLLLRSSSTDSISLRSRESSSNQPRLVVETNGGSGDTTAPSVPNGLNGDAPESGRVVLKWNAASDNNTVTGYDIFRNGVLLTTTNTNSFADTGVAASREYSYRVRSRDAASNVSGLSNTIEVDTPAPTRTFTFVPVADTYVVETSPTTNYGRKTVLRTEGGSDPDSVSYLRFTIGGLTGGVYRATLRVFVPAGSGNGSSDGPELHRISSTILWDETTPTWATKPIWVTSKAGDAGAIEAGTWVEYDVSAIVSKNGNYGWALVSISTDLAVFSSRQGANPPQLVVTSFTTGSAAAAEVAAEPTATVTVTPTVTPEPVSTLPFIDGFESGDLVNWSVGSGVGVTSSIAKSGSYALLVRSNGSDEVSDISASALRPLPDELGEVYVRTSVFVDRRGENPINLVTIIGTKETELVSLIVDRDGKLALLNMRTGLSTVLGDLSSDTWHDVQLHLISSGNASRVDVWLEGDLVYRDRQSISRRDIVAVSLGDDSKRRTFAVAFDDFAIDTTCIGTCSSELKIPVPEETKVVVSPTDEPTLAPTVTTEPTPTPEPTIEPTQEPTTEPTVEPTETPEPTIEPEPSVETTPEPQE